MSSFTKLTYHVIFSTKIAAAAIAALVFRVVDPPPWADAHGYMLSPLSRLGDRWSGPPQ